MSIAIKVVQFPDVLDNPIAKQLQKEIEKTIECGANIILLDLENVEVITRSGLMALLLMLKTVQMSDKKLFIRSMSDPVRMLFEITGLDQVFDTYPDENELENTILLKNAPEFKSSLVAGFEREGGAIAERVFSRSPSPSLLISHSDSTL